MSAEALSGPVPASRRAASYDRATIWFHWLTAGLVALLWVMGQVTDWLPRGAFRGGVWSVHVLLGYGLILVLALRIGWRASAGRALPPVGGPVLHRAAKAAHRALYLLLIAVVATGVLNASYRGFQLFGAWATPQFGSGDPATRRAINEWHEWAANLTILLASAHAAAALVHHYVWRDGLLDRLRVR